MRYGVGTGMLIVAGLLVFCWFLGTGTRNYEPAEEHRVGVDAVPVIHQLPRLSRKQLLHQNREESTTLKLSPSLSHQNQEEATTPKLSPNLPHLNQKDSTTLQLSPSLPSPFIPLSGQDVDGVEKFVFFVGYPRSGHSIIGSMMDAHPDMVIAHEFMLFTEWDKDPNFRKKTYLFNTLYNESYQDVMYGWRSSKQNPDKILKGYSLDIPSSWQGRFRQLRVIGDKSGGNAATVYSQSPEGFCRSYKELVDTVKIPVHVIHVVRNPYDMIATQMLYMANEYRNATTDHPYDNVKRLRNMIGFIDSLASAIHGMVEDCHLENTLEIHHADHVKDPKGTLQQICDFLDVECLEDYLQECEDKAYRKLSKTRKRVVWNPEANTQVKAIIKKFPFFHRYSMDEDYMIVY